MRHNLIRYNLGYEDVTVLRQESLHHEAVDAIVGASLLLAMEDTHTERVSADIRMTLFLWQECGHLEVLEHLELFPILSISQEACHIEGIGGYVHVGTALGQDSMHDEELVADIHLGARIRKEASHTEALDASVHIGADLFQDCCHKETVHALVSVALKRHRIFYIDAEIPPGAEIRIDSDNFTVLMVHDGVVTNMRRYFRGDWIHFDRSTRVLSILGSNNQLEGHVIYSDRWI